MNKLAANPKLPDVDKASVRSAIDKYETWVEKMNGLSSEGDDKVNALVDALNEY